MEPSKTPERLVAEARALLEAGKADEAIESCRRALAIDPDCLAAHVCMARARLPGDDYLVHLRRFHETLRPRTYVEIGVDAGRTLSLARPPTLAFGVDPAQKEAPPFAAQTRLFAMESDVFFESGQAARALGGLPIDLAFVDGLHLFEQALQDFIHLERHAERGSVVLFHDCLPLDRATASRERRTGFWTGDVWKVVSILAAYRPDLTVFVIPAWPTGLGVVAGLDPASRALTDLFEQIVAEFVPKEWNESAEGAPLPLVANDGPAILARIARVGRAG